MGRSKEGTSFAALPSTLVSNVLKDIETNQDSIKKFYLKHAALCDAGAHRYLKCVTSNPTSQARHKKDEDQCIL